MPHPLPTVKAVCPHDCPDTCGLVVTVDPESGRAVELRGRPRPPVHPRLPLPEGGHYLDRVYHPGPAAIPACGGSAGRARAGSSGSAGTRRSAPSPTASGPSPPRPTARRRSCRTATPARWASCRTASLDRRFFHRLGASLLDRTICATAGAAGCDVTLGTRAVVDPEAVVHARYIVNWGSNTTVTNIHFWTVEHEARKRGARIVTIDPYRSPTAAEVRLVDPDPPRHRRRARPGRDARPLRATGWQDDDYLRPLLPRRRRTPRPRVLNEYPPAKVVARSPGWPSATIETVRHGVPPRCATAAARRSSA